MKKRNENLNERLAKSREITRKQQQTTELLLERTKALLKEVKRCP